MGGFFFSTHCFCKNCLKTTFSIEKTHFLPPFFFQKNLPEFNEDLPLKESLAKILP